VGAAGQTSKDQGPFMAVMNQWKENGYDSMEVKMNMDFNFFLFSNEGRIYNYYYYL
jgi:hypothetical protein